jgi:hypothetical protein
MVNAGVRCGRCGAAITAGARFCMKCGADVSGEQTRVATRTADGPESTTTPVQPASADLMERLREVTLGDYEILAELGRGGMATVFLAHDLQLDRKVAIKVMSPHLVFGEGMIERFKLEARTAAGLSHPHIIPIYAVREVDDLFYFVMKFIEGCALDTIVKQSAPLEVPLVRSIVSRIGEALGYAHRRGVIHRDIKPANIMIDVEGMPIVTDFGIAKVSDKQGLTMTGTTMGTPTYMSPEQCNADPVTGASDQYSLGVMAFEMLTGRPPYEGDSVMNIMFKHCHGPVPEPESLGPHVPLDLATAIVRMLAKAPADRWPTIEEALPHLRGSAPAHDETVRARMIEFALAGTNRQILARVSTPISPSPIIQKSGAPARRAREQGGATRPVPGEATVPRAKPGPAPRRWPRRGQAAAALAVLAVGTAAVLALMRPWQARPAGSGQIVPTATPPATDSATASVPVDSAVHDSIPAAPPPTVVPPAPTPAVTEVRMLGAPTTLSMGDTALLQALVLDQQGRLMARQPRWSSSDPQVARIEQGGRLRALAPGRVVVVAEADGRRAQAAIMVTAVVAGVDVAPGTAELRVGQAVVLVARVRGPDGGALPDRLVTWRSSNEAVAVVSGTGRVAAMGPGTAVVSAASEGQVGSAEITVAAPPPSEPPPVQQQASPPPVTEDPNTAIAQVVLAYAAALQAKDMARVKALYPEMSGATEQQTREALQAMEALQVRLGASNITVNGTDARARVVGAMVYKGGRLDVSNVYLFERRSDRWVIVGIN